VRPWPWLELYGSYTWDDVELIRDDLTGLEGANLPLIPEHRGTAGVRFLLPHDLEAGLNGNFIGPRPFVNDLAGDFGKLGSYQIFDTHFAWRPRIGEHLRLGIETNIYNLFDQEYAEVGGIRTFFDPVTFAPLRERRFFPSPGRNWDVRLMLELTL
jgi:outer membrane receptor protein involved in Fe transport